MAAALANALTNASKAFGPFIAPSGAGLSLTYEAFSDEARVRDALTAASLRRDEPVHVLTSNHPCDLVALFGVWLAGGVAVAIHRTTPVPDFDSKDVYAHAVIANYAAYFARKLDRSFTDESRSPLMRLRAFAADATDGVLRFEFRRGCLVGNLGQEMGSLEEGFRVLLLDVLDTWRGRVRDCVEEARVAGEIATPVDSASLARFFWSAWEGAVLCAKLERSRTPLDNVGHLFFDHMLMPRDVI